MRWFEDSRVSRTADILVVCTGNVCRSPYVAALLRAGLPELVITSAGTDAVVGAVPVPEVLRALQVRGVDPSVSTGRVLSRGMVRGARLIVTATRLQRTRVVALESAARSRAFTLKELARVATATPDAHGIDGIVAAAATMAQTLEKIDHDDDLDDPIGLGRAAYDRMADEVDAALSILIPALTPRADAG